KRSQYSVIAVPALYGKPFRSRYPGRRFLVMTSRLPYFGPPVPGFGFPSWALALPAARPNHRAAESPCHVGWPAGGNAAPKWNRRVCRPASVSTRSVLSSCHVMYSRLGFRIRSAALQDLQLSPAATSFDGFQVSVI